MYVIAFFTVVILFSAILFIGIKVAESTDKHKGSPRKSDFVISPNPYIGMYRYSA